MKKFALILVLCAIGAAAFAASYTDNTYQKLAEEYAAKAQRALDAGEYDLSEEYALKAGENAELSKAFIDSMLNSTEAEEAIAKAQEKLDWAKSVGAESTYPTAYASAVEALDNARSAFEQENFDASKQYASLVEEALAGVSEASPLPQYYIVKPWAESRDCFWTIAGRSYVYNNPELWENLYQANKSALPKPDDPNIILPGMKIEIPSISGEIRSGTFDAAKQYPEYER